MEDIDFWLSLDSGAHSWFEKFIQDERDSSFRSNKSLNYDVVRSRFFKSFLDKYIGYLNEVGNDFRFYVSLDVIGHPKYTWDILKYMESNGLHPIPAFHLFEDFSWLSKMIDNYEYIGVGVVNKGAFALPFEGWIRKVFKEYIQLPNGEPRVKVHGFAANALDILKQYPFYSCDASTWSFGARLGHTQIPNFVIRNNEVQSYDYFPHRIKSIALTPRRVGDNSHYKRLSPSNKFIIDQYFLHCGSDVNLLCAEGNDGYFERDYANALFFINAEKELKKHYGELFNYSQGGNIYLAGTASSSSNTVPGIYKLIKRLFEREKDLKFLLSYWYDSYANTCITLERALNRGELLDECVEALGDYKRELNTTCNESKKASEKYLWETPHLEDLDLSELNESHRTEKQFRDARTQARDDLIETNLKKRLDEAPKEPMKIRVRPITPVEPVPEPELEPEILVEEVSLPLDELEVDLDKVVMKISPLVRFPDMEILVSKSTTIQELNDLVDAALKVTLGTTNHELVSLTIEENIDAH